jgi:hypothetical protein
VELRVLNSVELGEQAKASANILDGGLEFAVAGPEHVISSVYMT